MAKGFTNVHIPNWSIPTIWGGASLLQMLLRGIEELETVLRDWDWDFFINMSESDYPLKLVWCTSHDYYMILHDTYMEIM